MTDRLEKVAVQLAKADKTSEVEDDALEEELLNGGSPKAVSSPTSSSQHAIVPPTGDESDPLGNRVQQIFGKRRAIEESGPETSSKVANTNGSDGATGNDVTNVTVNTNSDDNVVTNITEKDGSETANDTVTNITVKDAPDGESTVPPAASTGVETPSKVGEMETDHRHDR